MRLTGTAFVKVEIMRGCIWVNLAQIVKIEPHYAGGCVLVTSSGERISARQSAEKILSGGGA